MKIIKKICRLIYPYLRIKDTGRDYKFQIFAGLIYENGAPHHCYKCDHNKFKNKITDSNEYGVLEMESSCEKCKTKNGYWSYGYWQL